MVSLSQIDTGRHITVPLTGKEKHIKDFEVSLVHTQRPLCLLPELVPELKKFQILKVAALILEILVKDKEETLKTF